MSKQDEFIKQLYYGDDLFYENTRKDSSKKCELNKIRDEIHKKIMKALIQVYGEYFLIEDRKYMLGNFKKVSFFIW